MKNIKGKFVTFEGCEGVGKSTQIRLLCEWLTQNNIDFVKTREPGGSQIAEKIRNIIMDAQNEGMSDICEALLYSASRAQHLHDIVLPALNEGKLVICDRFIDSTFAYQGYAKGLGTDYISKLNALATNNLFPDATIFLDLAPKEAFLRKGGASQDRLEQLGSEFHERVYQGYKLLQKSFPYRIFSVDCSGTKYETNQKIIELLQKKKII